MSLITTPTYLSTLPYARCVVGSCTRQTSRGRLIMFVWMITIVTVPSHLSVKDPDNEEEYYKHWALTTSDICLLGIFEFLFWKYNVCRTLECSFLIWQDYVQNMYYLATLLIVCFRKRVTFGFFLIFVKCLPLNFQFHSTVWYCTVSQFSKT